MPRLPPLSNAKRRFFECFNGDHFSITRVDEKIARLKAAVSIFIKWIDCGKTLEVTLWLWNVLHLDAVLQRTLRHWSSRTATPAHLVLDERNEVLVEVSTNLGAILHEYRENIVSRCKGSKRISLRATIAKEIDAALKAVIRSLGAESSVADSYLQYHYPEVTPIDLGIEQELRNKAAAHLDCYLSGESSDYPLFFAADEISMLKCLYDSNRSIKAFAHKFGLTETDAANKVQKLYEKVTLYLGEV